KIRPWTLPYLYVVILAPFKFLGIESPFTLATIARLFSGCVALYTLIEFTKTFKAFLPESRRDLFTKFTLLFWPLVFMGVRTSSDNIATCFFIIAVSIILRSISKRTLLMGGLLLGLAFSLRHQTGVLSLAFGLWILFSKKIDPLTWFKFFSSSILIGVLVGVGLDSLGYGSFTLTPVNYLTENLIKDKISSFGVSPWWAYFTLTVKKLHLFGVILLISSIVYIKKFPKSLESVLVITFLAFHSIIGHKELRFIYPLIYFSVFMMFKVIDFNRFKKSFNFLFIVSIIGTTIVSFKPAYTPMKFYKFLYSFNQGEALELYTFKDRKGRYPDLEMDVYKREKLTLIRNTSINKESFHTFTTKYSDLEMINSNYKCELKYISYPQWILKFNIFKWRDRSNIWAINHCFKRP
uniref:hypothetical protein n=1 Tax=Halobacteriovorax sp. TaxID=2020862 RepID=UPI003566B1A3